MVNISLSLLALQRENVSNTDWQHFNWKWPRQSYANKKEKTYETKSKNKRFPQINKFTCRNTLEGIPRKTNLESKNIRENPKLNKEHEVAEKIEIYYFDHGNSAYYHTTDVVPILLTEKFAEKSNSAATRFWAEIFGYVHIGTSFLTAFLLQFLRCILFSLVRPLTVGVIQLMADYFIKPVLSIVFNGLIQPVLILFYNIATSLRDCCEPLAAALGFFIKEVALLFKSCRLIEITRNYGRNDANT
ncbi:uncharacterized protein LOC106647079 [Copidosoma floridanum]|uniref:uncharacterized protein LOC106647078 n=1 Tax=Copidosoma floridanum TaxID=29053 RepID=UPI000C6FBC83|nr:uncharacterized protein LOC106647078 [Copidosoma floridanum]XP_023247960.1 uncharacterized protein LOC106647079 [Copidosoma floridanum]